MDPAPASQPAPAAPGSGFAASLREHTKAVHRAAERAGFVADLLHGRATTAGYAAYLRNLRPIYAALEEALAAETDDALVRPFAAAGLTRLAALDADLRAIDPSGSDRPPLSAAEAYAAAIRAASRDPARLVAHAYARYLGDLSGGQILKPLLARTLGLGASALTVYDFPAYSDLAVPKAALRAALDTVPEQGDRADRLRTEAVLAFRHTIAVSEAVQMALAPA